jgi:hypothetical protein
VTLLICRLGLERDDFLTLPHVLTATKGALSVIETLAVFLECLKMDDYNSFWTPWSAYQLSNAVTLLLQQAIRVHQHASDEHHSDRERALSDIFALLQRVVSSILVASEHWEVAEAASPRIKSLIKAMPAIPGVEHIQAMLVATDLMPPPPDWPQMEPEPDANILALFDWLNGDRVF